MKKLTVKIEIKSVEDWNVNWNSEADRKDHLKKLGIEIEGALSKELGIRLSEVRVLEMNLEEK